LVQLPTGRASRGRVGAKAPEDDVLADDEGRGRRADPAHEGRLRSNVLRIRLEQLLYLVEVLQHVELDLRLERVEACPDRLFQPSLGVRQVCGDELGLLEDADRAAAGLDLFLGYRVQVDHRSARDEKLVDVAQGVHDALTFDSSQRRGEQGQVEARPWGVGLGRPDNREGHALGEPRGQSDASIRDPIGIRVDAENGRSGVRVAEGQSPVAAAELQHAKAVHGRESRECRRLRALGVYPPSHGRIMIDPRGSADRWSGDAMSLTTYSASRPTPGTNPFSIRWPMNRNIRGKRTNRVGALWIRKGT
jgi:hypothetical protein